MLATTAFAAARRFAGKTVAPTAVRAFCARPEPSQSENLTDIGTRRIFNEDHDAFRSSVRRFYDEEVVPHHRGWEKEGHVPREIWQEAGKNGLLCVAMPEEYGGGGGDMLYAAVTWEEQSYSGCTGLGTSLHSEICAPYLLKYGTEEQKQQWLPPMASGDAISAIAMTEPGAGSDLQGIRTMAKRDGDDWILNGSKTFITNGYHSDVVLVVARTDSDAKAAHGTSLFVVDAKAPGFNKGRKLEKMGMAAQDTSELFFEDVRLTNDHILGGEAGLNRGFYMLMSELGQERLLIAAMATAASEACYEITRAYVKERQAFGRSIADLQVIKHKLAHLKTDIAVTRAFVDQCLELHNEGRLDTQLASMAKMWATDLQGRAADIGVQLHGGNGYMMEYPIARHFVDARVQRIYGGTNEIMTELIARSL